MARAKRAPSKSVELLPYEERIVGFTVSPRPRSATQAERASIREAITGGGKTFAGSTTDLGDEGLALFNRMPASAWHVYSNDLYVILNQWGLRALPGIVACGAGPISQVVPVSTHIDSPRIAPLMAEAYGRLPKQRAQAEKWLFDFSEAAAIGLVPAAAHGRGGAKKYAEGALRRLIEQGRGEVVGDVISRYGLDTSLAALIKKLGKQKAPSVNVDGGLPGLLEQLLTARPTRDSYARLDRLAHIDSERAIFALAELSQNARSRPLRRAAEKCLAAGGVRRGISAEALSLWIVPKLGLDEPGFSLGGVALRYAASTELEAEIIGPDGARTRKLPQTAPRGVKRQFESLKKALKKWSPALCRRFEGRMLAGDAWTRDEFLQYFVGHPVLAGLSRGLVFSAAGVLFRVTEDSTLATDRDRPFELPASAHITIVHPLDATAEALETWRARFSENGIVQPFPQLAREFAVVKAVKGRVPSFAGASISAGRLMGLQRRGWKHRHGYVEHGTVLRKIWRDHLGCMAVVHFTPGFRLDSFDGDEPQRITAVELDHRDAAPTARLLSELARDLGLA